MEPQVQVIVDEIDHAISRAELRAQELREHYGPGHKTALRVLAGSLHRLRAFRLALVAERQPGSRLN
jgi:hypothetical protein